MSIMSLKLKVEGCLLTRLERVKEGREEKKGRKEGRREKEGILLRSLYQGPLFTKVKSKDGMFGCLWGALRATQGRAISRASFLFWTRADGSLQNRSKGRFWQRPLPDLF